MIRGEFGGMEHLAEEMEVVKMESEEAPNDAQEHEPVRYVIDDEPAPTETQKANYQPRKTRKGLWSALALMTGLGFAGSAQAERSFRSSSDTTSSSQLPHYLV